MIYLFIARPCQRCIKRDLASTCTDGARKKAKYLQDVHGNGFSRYITNFIYLLFWLLKHPLFYFIFGKKKDSAVNEPDNNATFNPQLGVQMGEMNNTIPSDNSSINTSIVDTESFSEL